jgi:hypothetical protein
LPLRLPLPTREAAADRAATAPVAQELLERYNPTHGMTVQERTHLTARRVGLDLPTEAKPMPE